MFIGLTLRYRQVILHRLTLADNCTPSTRSTLEFILRTFHLLCQGLYPPRLSKPQSNLFVGIRAARIFRV